MGFREDLTQAKQDMTDTAVRIDNAKGDVDRLHAKIMEMENSPDLLGPADKALFAEIVTLAAAAKASMTELDDKTPLPVVDPPPSPPVGDPPVDPQPLGARRR